VVSLDKAHIAHPPVVGNAVDAVALGHRGGVSRREVREVIETGERQGVLDTTEYEMLRRSFQFSTTIAKEVMTPRLDITAIDADTTPTDALRTCVTSDHSRFPVYRGTFDNVVGTVAVETLVAREDDFGDLTTAELCEPVLSVPESKSVDDLLTEMKAERIQMAVVVDEFGATAGIVTVEDIVAQIVGQLLTDSDTEAVEVVDETSALVSGETPIETVNDALDLDIPEGEEFETLAGYLFNRAGRLVEQGETVTDGGLRFEVVRTDGTRIRAVRISVDDPEQTAATSFETSG
jgi:CBS domain containing-hemolysin-like protein